MGVTIRNIPHNQEEIKKYKVRVIAGKGGLFTEGLIMLIF